MDIVQATRLLEYVAALTGYQQGIDTGLKLRNAFEKDPVKALQDQKVGEGGAVALYRCAVNVADDPVPNPRRSSMQDAIDSVVMGAWPGPVGPVATEPNVFYDSDPDSVFYMLLLLVVDHVAGRVTTGYIQTYSQEIVTRYRLSQDRWEVFRDGPRAAVADKLMEEFRGWNPKGDWHTNGPYPAGCQDTDDGKVLAVLWADPRAEIRRIQKPWGSKGDGTVSVDIYGQGIYPTARFYLDGTNGVFEFVGPTLIVAGSTFRCTHLTSAIDLTTIPTGTYTVNATYGTPGYDLADFHTHSKFFVDD